MFDEKWTVLSERTVLDHPYVNVRMQEVQLPDDRLIPDWPIVDTRDYVNAMVLNPAGQIMVLEGYKHGLGRASWQVLGGYLEPGEDPFAAVQRELLEETGYRSNDWQRLGNFVVDPNRVTANGHFFLARDAAQIAVADHDDLEQFSLRWVSREEITRALFDGRVAAMSYAINIAMGLLALDR